MTISRISASSYLNTAPLVWSFLYGRNHGKVELILDNAPARSAELLAAGRVDAALVPIIAFQLIEDLRLVPHVCVGAKRRVRSVCLFTRGMDLGDVRSVSLDNSSRTSAALTKIIFREFLDVEPEWRGAEPNVDELLTSTDAALLIGDPALILSSTSNSPGAYRVFDLAELWHQHTGLGFVFAMWMTRHERFDFDLASARNEGLDHLEDIIANYLPGIGLEREEMRDYLTNNISFTIDESMAAGMQLFFELAAKNSLIPRVRPLTFI